MFRQSPSRSQRSKGIKAKHFLQICFLLAICFWLVYQVKHSHDKKKEFDASDAKISLRTQGSSEVLNLGRKDLHPKVEGTAMVSKKQDEEAEEEEITGEEEENKHEEEPEQENHKSEEKDDDTQEGGDEEMEEHEQEKSDMDVDREEDVVDEEKEKEEGDEKEVEENDFEDNNGQLEQENSSEERDDDDGTEKNNHEAREEHYKADDASSAVTHESQSQTITVETENKNENGNSENLNEPKLSSEDEVLNTEHDDVGENIINSKTQEREMIENSGPLNNTANGALDNVASKSEDASSSPNSTFIEQSNDHPSVINNTTDVITGAGGSSLQNGTETQNTHEENAAIGVTTGYGPGLETITLDQGNRTLGGSNATEAENSGAVDGKEGNDDSALKMENPDEVQNDPIDSSDSSTALEKVRTDIETLPEIQTEGSNSEDTAEE